MPLSFRQCFQVGAAQVVGNEAREFAFFVARREFLHDGAALGVGDIGLHLLAQGAFADGGEAFAQGVEVGATGELGAEAVEVAEDAPVDNADQAVEFEQAVLQQGGSEQDFRADVSQRVLQGFGDDVAFFIDVAQAVRFVEYDEIPGDTLDVGRFGFGELVGTDDGALLVKRVFAGFAQGVVVFAFEDDAIQAEFFLYFLMPLFAQVGRGDDKNAAFALCPVLQDDEAGFDGFAQPHFVGKDDAAREGIAAGEKRGINLVRVEVYLGIDQGRGEGFDAVAGSAPGRLPGKVLALLWGGLVHRGLLVTVLRFIAIHRKFQTRRAAEDSTQYKWVYACGGWYPGARAALSTP